MELAAAIAAYALQDNIKGLLTEKINTTMHQYGKEPEATDAIDFLQSRVIFQFLLYVKIIDHVTEMYNAYFLVQTKLN